MKSEQLAKKVLYFIRSAVPTKAEYDAASKLEGKVLFRNGSVVTEEDSLESCDAVAGTIPARYKGIKVEGEQVPAPVDIKGQLLTFCGAAGIEEVTPETTLDQDAEALKQYTFDAKDLAPSEFELLKSLGIDIIVQS